MGGGRIFPKTSVPLSLMMTYRMSLISAGSVSLELDSTFKSVSVLKAGIPMCTISKQEMRKPLKNPTCGHVYDEVRHRELTCKQCADS
jgi:hypothetical protein